ncbi:hypothetical protein FRC08_003459 [Ceratobasidium sp. 394]|nr:hypothetical protein FRC08_003459 [Ceratobasidium sp. 394]
MGIHVGFCPVSLGSILSSLCTHSLLTLTPWIVPVGHSQTGSIVPTARRFCNAALQDFERGVRDWVTAGRPSTFKLAQEAEHQAAQAEFFQEGQALTPPPVNYLEDLREELPGAGAWWSGERKGKENQCPQAIP